MGGRGTGSGLFPDPDQVNDLMTSARAMGYKTLRYTDSTGRQRDIRVDAKGSGTMTAAYNAQVAQYVQLAANVGTNRLRQDLAAKERSYQRQDVKAQALKTINPSQAKTAATLAAKLDAEIRSLYMALRIAQSKGYPDNVF